MLKRNSRPLLALLQIWRLSKVRTSWPYTGWFWKFFERFRKKPTIDRPEYWKIVKCRILSEVCMIKSTVSPQMWCIKSIKGWFTHPQICWQDFVKQTCRKQKIWPHLFSQNLFSRPNLLWSRAIMAFECDRRWLLFFGSTYKAINSM